MPVMAHPGIHGLTQEGFANYLEKLIANYSLVSLADVLRSLSGGGLPNNAALVSFDDGLRCQYENGLPELEKKGVPAAFFALGCPYAQSRAASVHKLHWLRANLGDAELLKHMELMDPAQLSGQHPDAVDGSTAMQHYRYDNETAARLKYFLNYVMAESFTVKLVDELLSRTGMHEEAFVALYYMDGGMLRDLAERGWLGSHAMSHRPLAVMDENALRSELSDSRQVLEDITGVEIRTVSYPLGNARAVDRSVATAAAGAGYVAGWTMERARNVSTADPLLFARMDAADDVWGLEIPARTRYVNERAECI